MKMQIYREDSSMPKKMKSVNDLKLKKTASIKRGSLLEANFDKND